MSDEKEKLFFSHKRALITGGSSGIGFSVAKRLVLAGSDIWLVARDLTRLEKAKKDLEALKISPTQKTGFTSSDVSKEKGAVQAIKDASDTIGLPDIIVNSAGIARPGYFQELSGDIFHEQMDVNYFGSLNIIRAAIPEMIRRGSGYIVNISSMAGILGVFGYTAYGASKYAVRGFTDTLRAEMKPLGINVSLVFPPDTDTPQLAYESQFKPFETKIIASTAGTTSPDRVARDIIRGIMKKRYMIFTGLDNKFLYWLIGKLGSLQYPMMDMMVSDAINKKKKAAKTKK